MMFSLLIFSIIENKTGNNNNNNSKIKVQSWVNTREHNHIIIKNQMFAFRFDYSILKNPYGNLMIF